MTRNTRIGVVAIATVVGVLAGYHEYSNHSTQARSNICVEATDTLQGLIIKHEMSNPSGAQIPIKKIEVDKDLTITVNTVGDQTKCRAAVIVDID